LFEFSVRSVVSLWICIAAVVRIMFRIRSREQLLPPQAQSLLALEWFLSGSMMEVPYSHALEWREFFIVLPGKHLDLLTALRESCPLHQVLEAPQRFWQRSVSAIFCLARCAGCGASRKTSATYRFLFGKALSLTLCAHVAFYAASVPR